MIRFRISHHHIWGYEIVEVLDNDGQFLASILPSTENVITIMSAHLLGAAERDVRSFVGYDYGTRERPIPSIELTFNPGPYRIENGRIVRVERSSEPPLAQSENGQ